MSNIIMADKKSGGEAVLIRKTITANGTFAAADDNADGYSSVTVDVPSSGYTAAEIATGDAPNGVIVLDVARIRENAFHDCKNLGKVTLLNNCSLGYGAFAGSSITEFVAIRLARVAAEASFASCTKLKKIIIPAATYFEYKMCSGCNTLEIADIGGGAITRGAIFQNCTTLGTIIIRSNTLCTLGNISNLGGTPFASGGSGGTIYIPETLYDHLGDGTSLDYKAATNWSTLDGYGTITWAKIEGSQYENAYADGTPIS
jgi:hypothetical protein